ncbi:MAG TPA: hypothetical protein VFO67_14105 [Gemmatimonadales bacterium]|nr:hypothetical protein [Gemmatimonadales bacterium]
MKRELVFAFLAAVLLYLPTARYGYVQDDRAIVVSNPAAHSIGAALRAFDDPYWPPESGAGLYRPVTILSFAIDWTVSGGSAGWLHVMNALWHGLVTVLLVLILFRWLPPLGAAAAGLVFAWHPVHVEAVASIVGRAELLVAVGILGAVLAARRGWWATAVVLAALAMFSKEHGVIAGVVILIDKWLQPDGQGVRTPPAFWAALVVATVAFLGAWFAVGWVGEADEAAVFYGASAFERLAIALPAVWRAATLLVWPASLSVDYNPQVLPVRTGFSLAALAGLGIIIAIPLIVLYCRRRAPAISFAAALAALSYLPTSNLFFPSGIVLAERNLYLAVALPATLLGTALAPILHSRAPHAAPLASLGAGSRTTGVRLSLMAVSVLLVLAGWRSLARLPAWRDNRSQLIALLADHPESYRAHASAAAVLAGMQDTAGARREYRIADSLFSEDPYVAGAHAIFLLNVGDTLGARPLIDRLSSRAETPAQRMALRARFLYRLRRGELAGARSVADSARQRFPGEVPWYHPYLQ